VVKKIIGGKEVDVKGDEIKATQCATFTCPPDRDYDRLPIGGGAYLQVTKSGGRYWATKYYCKGIFDSILRLSVFGRIGGES
jgi:hypothetical protein